MRLSAFLVLAAFSTLATAQSNLLTNPDFSDGNAGFQSGYTYFTGSPLPEGRYVIEGNPREHHPLQGNFNDHTTGTGLMFVANGGTLSNVYDYPLWQETVPVIQDGDYRFTGWTTTANVNDSNPARLAARINGQTVLASFIVPSQGGSWAQFVFDWSSLGATNATISIFNTNTAANGNDLALDDFSFTRTPPVPEPAPLAAFGFGALRILRRRKRA